MEPAPEKEDAQGEPPNDKPERKWNADRAQVIVAYLTLVALVVVMYQTYLSQRQYKLQEDTTNRTWAAGHLAAIYSDPPLPRHVRQEAVRAYLRLQRITNGEVRLPNADLREMDLEKEIFAKADLADAKLERCILNGADLRKAKLHRADLFGAYLNDAHLEGAELPDANLAGTRLIGSYLNGADLRGAKFSKFVGQDYATFFKSYVLGAIVMGANFEEAIFDSSTIFCDVNADGAKLHLAIGLDAKLVESCTFRASSSTTLPPGLTLVESSVQPRRKE